MLVTVKCPECKQRHKAEYTAEEAARARPTEETCDTCWAAIQKRNAANIAAVENAPIERKTMPYQDYLKSDYWKMKRMKFIKRAGNRCEMCGVLHVGLHVHHLTYANRGNEQDSDCVALCPTCHAQTHNKPIPQDFWRDFFISQMRFSAKERAEIQQRHDAAREAWLNS